MKKALLLLLVCLSAAGVALAHPPAANVNFTSERGVPFNVVLDGRIITRGLARQVHLDRLMPGLHYADFSVPTPYGGTVRMRSRVWLEPGLETTFVLLTRPGRPLGLRQVGAVGLLYGPGMGQGECDNYPDRGYDRNDDYYDNDDYNNGGGYPSGTYGQRPNQPAPNGHYDQGQRNDGPDGYRQPQPGSYDPNSNYNAPNSNGYPGSAPGYQLLEPADVNGLMQEMNRAPFEDARLQLAKQALDQSGIRAEYLQRLLKGFHFDASRVEFAKFAYPHVVDRQNFYKVYSSFDFSSNAREVQDAVARM